MLFLLNVNPFYPSVWHEVPETVFFGEKPSVYAGAYQHAAMRENGGEGHAQPDIPEADGRGEENPSGERLPAPPSDGEVPRPVPPQPRLPEKGAGGN